MIAKDGFAEGQEVGIGFVYSDEDKRIIELATSLKKKAEGLTPETNVDSLPKWIRDSNRLGVWSRHRWDKVKKEHVHYPKQKFAYAINKDGELRIGANSKEWCSPKRGGRYADFEEAVAHQKRRNIMKWPSGLNFYLGGSFGGIDLDGCRDPETGTLTSLAAAVVEKALSLGAYVEISPSGTGAKISGRLERVWSHGGNSVHMPPVATQDGKPVCEAIEAYCETGRHWTLTGNPLGEPWSTSQDEPVDLSPILDMIESDWPVKPGDGETEAKPAKDRSATPKRTSQAPSDGNEWWLWYDSTDQFARHDLESLGHKFVGTDSKPGELWQHSNATSETSFRFALGENGRWGFMPWTPNMGVPQNRWTNASFFIEKEKFKGDHQAFREHCVSLGWKAPSGEDFPQLLESFKTAKQDGSTEGDSGVTGDTGANLTLGELPPEHEGDVKANQADQAPPVEPPPGCIPATPNKSEAPSPATLEDLPDDILRVPGLMGEIFDLINDTGICRLPTLAFAAALATQATLVGNKWESALFNKRTYAIFYLISLASTGTGKEHGQTVASKILDSACQLATKKNIVSNQRLVGPSFVASSPGFYRRLHESPVVFYPLDEISYLLEAMKVSPRQPPHFADLSQVLRNLYSSGGAIWRSPSKAKNEDNFEVVSPNVVILGTTTDHEFLRRIGPADILGGLLPRCQVFHQKPNRNYNAPPKQLVIPQSLLERAADWILFTPKEKVFEPIGHTPEAQATYLELWHAVTAEKDRLEDSGQEVAAAVWSRLMEQVAKMAMVFAASRANPKQEPVVINADDVTRAHRIASWSCSWMRDKFTSELVESADSDQIDWCDKNITDGMTLSVFTRKASRKIGTVQKIEPLLRTLEDMGRVFREKVINPTDSRRSHVVFRRPKGG